MKAPARAIIARQAVRAACLGILLSAATMAMAHQHGQSAPHSAPAPHAQARPQYAPPHASQPRSQGGGAQSGYRQNPQAYRPLGNPQVRPQSPYGASGMAGGPARPAYNGAPYSLRATPQPGHLPQWFAQHQNMPVGQQEHMLRQEPGFNRLNPADQQRQIQQLHRLNQMPEPQRERRLARSEAIERLSPSERMQVNQSSRQLSMLPADRQAQVRRAFNDLRGVPVDQRQTMLNSARYSSAFNPEERGMLSNLLRVEPYEPPR